MQGLLSLVQKAVENVSQLDPPLEEQEFIKGLVESGREPLRQLSSVIATCLGDPTTSTAERGAHADISTIAWFKSRKSLGKIRDRFVQAHRNLSTALIALSLIQR